MKKTLKSNQEIAEKMKSLKDDSQNPGTLTVLGQGTTIISLEDFDGTITWFHSRELVTPMETGTINFQAISAPLKVVNSEPIPVPPGAHAVLQKNSSDRSWTLRMMEK